ncbi:uroporphyrinogen-III synthase [Halonotius terrestris]|uniref:Uroporphyrinogen-III synthase n=1 Tax=Halonotius terrestris TaxID=2487750 RepID=A0A8J8TCP6_9EURY|nr:uroporphyrinogen-III synthase [Halonotius terrestris]TQQ81081.1 uroporphyrinogen-III synthase [Halonotius terrestris]
MSREVRVAVFRPDDDRLTEAVELLDSLGATPVPDPMLEIEPTGAVPQGDADYVVFTSKTGIELAADAGWEPDDTVLVSIGSGTTAAANAVGWTVDREPATYSSAGLVDLLADEVADSHVEVARSDHGSQVLLDGLADAGATVTETVLYQLVRPADAGDSTALAADGDLEAVAFTSSLTVEHFLDAADERGVRDAAIDGLADAVVGVIGEPTRETAETHGISVDIVPAETTFEALATRVVETAAPSYTE